MKSRLRLLREKRKLTQAELASLAGVGRTTIGNHETKTFLMPRESLAKIAAALEVPLEEILEKNQELNKSEGWAVEEDRPLPYGEKKNFDPYESLDSLTRIEGETWEKKIIAAVQQFPVARKEARQRYIEQIISDLKAYDEWAETHYQPIREALLRRARQNHDKKEP